MGQNRLYKEDSEAEMTGKVHIKGLGSCGFVFCFFMKMRESSSPRN
jgi:hypothetical protein